MTPPPMTPPTKWAWGRKEVPGSDYPDWKRSFGPFIFISGIIPFVICYFIFSLVMPWWMLWIVSPFFIFFTAVGLFGIQVMILFHILEKKREWGGGPARNQDKWITFKDREVEKLYKGKRIPMETFYEFYFDGKIDIKGDVLDAMYHRWDFCKMVLTLSNIKFFACNFIPECIWHSRSQDESQVKDHYNRGNDFYEGFLGKNVMIYTSGLFKNRENTLEEAQNNKMKDVCERIGLKAGDKHLDLGCGWGTFVQYAAEKYGSKSTGLTLADEQVKFAMPNVIKKKLQDKVDFIVKDYREMDEKQIKYDKITCLEMSEHVGILRYHHFAKKVYDILEDDGIFYLQIAGLRRSWQIEDFVWGLFMAKYVFPGADASAPLFFPIFQLENNGFEIKSVENIGIHYSATIKRWYDNWNRPENKEAITEKYGERAYREWILFLSWSVIIAENGYSTCWQITAYKNRDAFDRKRFVGTDRCDW